MSSSSTSPGGMEELRRPSNGVSNSEAHPRSPTNHDENSFDRKESMNTNGEVPKPKRIACIICRKRKLKCDGNKPSCATCKRLNHSCSYDEVRRKSGPKRGYVKALEERLSMENA
jgi:hypothetical protein